MARPSRLRLLMALSPGTTASTRRLATIYIHFRIGKHYNPPLKQKVSRDLMLSWQTDSEICGIMLPPCGEDWECEASLQMKRCLACKPDRILICTLREGQPAPTPSPASSPGPEAWSIVANLTAITTSSSKRCLCEKPSDSEMMHIFSKYVYFCLQILTDPGEGVCRDGWEWHHDQGPCRLHPRPVQVGPFQYCYYSLQWSA